MAKRETRSRTLRRTEDYQKKLLKAQGFKPTVKYADIMNANIYTTSMSTAELREVRKALSKRANQRLVRLESVNSEVFTSKSLAESGAGRVAKNYLAERDRKRFSETLSGAARGETPLTRQELQKEITALQDFLGSVTSTVKGAKEVEARRLEAFEEKGLGSLARDSNFYEFLKSDDYKYLRDKLGFDSETIMDYYNRSAKQGASAKEIAETFASFKEKAMNTDGYSANLKSLASEFKTIGVKL